MATKRATGPKPIATNRKARHDYDVIDTFECGIVLVGSEVKSLRDGKAQLKDSYARVEAGEL
jgi:SsrA-binding protein